jgi:ABC-type dipeptide/oligopeptide/nickel transport system permease subunit
MLHEAVESGTLVDAPWLLAPAAAIVISVFSLHLVSANSAQPERVV